MTLPPDSESQPPSFAELFADVVAALFAWASVRIRSQLRAHCDPEDLVQEVCYRAYRGFDAFDPDQGTFREWLFGIANNVLKEILSEVRRHPRGQLGSLSASRDGWGEVPDDASSVSRRACRDESLRAFVGKLLELTDEERRLFVYRGLEGLPHAQVGEILGIAPGAAEKRWERLQKKLEGWGARYPLIVP